MAFESLQTATRGRKKKRRTGLREYLAWGPERKGKVRAKALAKRPSTVSFRSDATEGKRRAALFGTSPRGFATAEPTRFPTQAERFGTSVPAEVAEPTAAAAPFVNRRGFLLPPAPSKRGFLLAPEAEAVPDLAMTMPAGLQGEGAPAEVSPEQGFFSKLLAGLQTDRSAFAFGKIGQAIMGRHQDTWQARLGGVGAEEAQKRVHSRYMKAIIAGETPDPEDISVLTPKQQMQGVQIQEAIAKRKADISIQESKVRIEELKVEETIAGREAKIKERERVTPSVPEAEAEAARERKNRLDIAGVRAEATKYSSDQYLARYTEPNEKAEAQARYDRAFALAKAEAGLAEDSTEALKVFNARMQRELPGFEPIVADLTPEEVSKQADLDLLGLSGRKTQ